MSLELVKTILQEHILNTFSVSKSEAEIEAIEVISLIEAKGGDPASLGRMETKRLAESVLGQRLTWKDKNKGKKHKSRKNSNEHYKHMLGRKRTW